MQATGADTADERWVLLAVAREGDTSERWAAALDAAEIEYELRIGDAAHLTSRASTVLGANPVPDSLFAFPLYVPVARREAAATVLVDQGWDGRFGQRPADGDRGHGGVGVKVALRGAAVAVAAGGAVTIALLLLREA